MAQRRKQTRAVGPYPHGSRWRVISIGADGRREYRSFESEGEGAAYVQAFNQVAESRTVSSAVTDYLEHLRANGKGGEGLRESSITTARHRLRAFLRCGERDLQLTDLDVTVATRFYSQRTKETKPDTHRGELKLARAFAEWCCERRYIDSNPFAAIRPIGRRSTGKAQLRVDEGRPFLETALGEGTEHGLAAAMLMLLGLRASEVCDRVVRDLDDGGKLLWIPVAKTKAGQRQLPIPEVLRDRLLVVVAGKEPSAPLFPGLTRHRLHYHVRRLCRAAKVPEVCPHGLRGTFATLSAQSGVNTDAVARTLGHAGTAVTRRHYIGGGAEATASVDRVLRVLEGGLSRGAAS